MNRKIARPVTNTEVLRQRRVLRPSTLIVSVITTLFMARSAVVGGLSGALVGLALCALLTGLYISVTGRQSWALIRGGRKMGGAIAIGAVVMFISAITVYGKLDNG